MKNIADDIIVLGAGPAGLTAAGAATGLGRRVLILEKARQPAGKLLLSGGGKGNVTNRSVGVADYVSAGPVSFAAAALKQFTPDMLLRRLAEADIAVEEREQGRIFCTRSAKDTLDMLCAALPVERYRSSAAEGSAIRGRDSALSRKSHPPEARGA